MSSAATTVRDADHIRRHIRPGQRAALTDVTSQYAVFGVMGPRSRDLLSRLTRADLRNEAFPFGTSQLIDLGYSTVRATRITYVGELGWELYVPAEFAVGVYEDLMRAGADLGVVNGGYYAIESLRLEKGYRAFGRELTPDYNPVEAGLLFTCKLAHRHPLPRPRGGREGEGRGRRGTGSCPFAVGSPEPMLWGGELVLRDGVAAGQVTSAAWGETLGRCAGLAYLWDPDGGADRRAVDRRGLLRRSTSAATCTLSTVSTKAAVRPRGAQDPSLNDGRPRVGKAEACVAPMLRISHKSCLLTFTISSVDGLIHH